MLQSKPHSTRKAGLLLAQYCAFLISATEALETEEDIEYICTALCDINFHYHVLNRLAGKEAGLLNYEGFNDFTEDYLEQYPVADEKKALFAKLGTKTILYGSRKLFPAFKSNILLNYETRFRRMFYDWYRPGLPGFITNRMTRNISGEAFRLCSTNANPNSIIQQLNIYMYGIGIENTEYFHDMHTEALGCLLPDGTGELRKLNHYLRRMKVVRQIASGLGVLRYRPKLFTLVPKYDTKHAFVHMETENSVAVLIKAEKKLRENTGRRFKIDRRFGEAGTLSWVHLLFDFYGITRNHWTRNCRGNQDEPHQIAKAGSLKTLRKGRDKRQELHQLRPFAWAIWTGLTKEEVEDNFVRMPWIIKSLDTDGIQVKVFMETLERTHIEDVEIPRSVRALMRFPLLGTLPLRNK